MTHEKPLLELRRAFGVQREAVSWAQQDQHPVAVVGRLHFRGAGVHVAVWTGLDWVPVRNLADLNEVLADAGALRRAPVLDQS